ncbi:hypothetical protein NQ317_012237 [Molorchus minor]|uniref:Iron-binding zinc finger CDGSH type domain-containing protein n=1 Tax=Molorchus minor TaxID=1323400 RepID=A0ABQ9K1K0_9CUCU|nr:hypothetical protein NQ317_012237 [Molorchus minor]
MINIFCRRSQSVHLNSICKTLYSTTKKFRGPKNALENVISADKQKENGVVYDKKPFKNTSGSWYVSDIPGVYVAEVNLTPFVMEHTKSNRPVRFQVEETKEYWLCNCKHTSNRPFCDGTTSQKSSKKLTQLLNNRIMIL